MSPASLHFHLVQCQDRETGGCDWKTAGPQGPLQTLQGSASNASQDSNRHRRQAGHVGLISPNISSVRCSVQGIPAHPFQARPLLRATTPLRCQIFQVFSHCSIEKYTCTVFCVGSLNYTCSKVITAIRLPHVAQRTSHRPEAGGHLFVMVPNVPANETRACFIYRVLRYIASGRPS